MHRIGVLLAAVGGALAFATAASAHAEISPAVALSGAGQLFTLAVPTEKEDVTTTKIELSAPDGFEIDSYVDAPGWQREANANGDVTWSGGNVPTDEDAVFQFIASADSAKTYAFTVRQTYSDGTVVDWSGPESSDTPAPQVELKSSFGGGSDTLAIVALVLGAIALVVAIAGLLTSAGRRSVA
jgi:uncharacterized protein YcnI